MITNHSLRVVLVSTLVACTSSEPTPDEPITITMSRPLAGERVVRGSLQRIEWEAPDGVDQVDLVLDANVIATVPNTGTFDWKVPFSASERLGAAQLQLAPSGEAAHTDGIDITFRALGGLRHNGTSEEYVWIDPTTGDVAIKGTVGDLQFLPFPRPATTDPATHRLYVLGVNANQASRIYTLDTESGDLIGDAPIADATTTIVAHDGNVLAFRADDATGTTKITTLDPQTGNESAFGTLGDLAFWNAQTTIDGGRLYALGLDAQQAGTIYELDLATGTVDQALTTLDGAPIDNLGGLGGTADELTAFRFDATTSTEQFVGIDPQTGAVTVIGSVGDLATWGYAAVVDPTNDLVYVFGSNGTEDKLYALDAGTGSMRYAVPVGFSPISAQLVD